MAGTASYCIGCGAPLGVDEAFCEDCGRPRAVVGAPTTASTFVADAGAAISKATAGYQAAAGVAGVATALPWKTIVGAEQLDVRSFLSTSALPTARRAVQRASLRKPGLSLAATAVLDLFVAAVSGGSGALGAAIPRLLMGGLTSLLSLITGSKSGALRSVTGVVSLLTALVQVVSLVVALIGGLLDGTSLLALAPMAIAAISALVMAVKTASVALRKGS